MNKVGLLPGNKTTVRKPGYKTQHSIFVYRSGGVDDNVDYEQSELCISVQMKLRSENSLSFEMI